MASPQWVHRAGIIAQLEQGQPHCALRLCVVGLDAKRRRQTICGLLRTAAPDQGDAEIEVRIQVIRLQPQHGPV